MQCHVAFVYRCIDFGIVYNTHAYTTVQQVYTYVFAYKVGFLCGKACGLDEGHNFEI